MSEVMAETTRVGGEQPQKVCTTCYMCACRCGIRVHLEDGRPRFIDGNRAHPVNRGVVCAKGAAGILHHESPARLRAPLKRVGERGRDALVEISWSEALDTAARWLSAVRASDPKKLAFFTGRDQSQALTGFWAAQFGTPNFAAHGGFCSVNVAAAGLYTIGGSFWEFGEPDLERARLFLLIGVAEDHDSNPLKLALAAMKARGGQIVAINPVRTGYAAIADVWLPIRPGTDGALILALVHELLRAGRVDAPYLADFTNAGWLVIEDPGGAEDGLFARDPAGRPLCRDRRTGELRPAEEPDAAPALRGAVRLADGRRARPVFELLAERYLEPRFGPEVAAEVTGVPAATIRSLAAALARAAFDDPPFLAEPWTDWRGRRHPGVEARAVAVHAMRGVSAHSNGFQTCRAIHLLQILLGAIDRPGSFRFEAPYPRPIPPGPLPCGKPEQVVPGRPMPGLPLGFPRGPEDLLLEPDGRPCRIDEAFSWDAPLAVHGLLQRVIGNAWRGDPYPIEVLFLYMANMAWNSAMATDETIRMLTDRDPSSGAYRIPKIIYADAFYSETVAYADLVLPDTTYFERWDALSLLDRPIGRADSVCDAIRRPVVRPEREVRPFQDVLLELGHRLGLPAFTAEDGTARYPGGYADYLVRHERAPGIGPLAGWRGSKGELVGRGPPNPRQLEAYIENGCFFEHRLPAGTRFVRHGNRDYLELAAELGLLAKPEPIFLQLYSEPLQRFRLAARGHGSVQPPERLCARIERYFDPLPFWYAPLEDEAGAAHEFPLAAVSQRPAAMYHSWGSHNAWLRQILGDNRLCIHRATAAALGIEDGDPIRVTSRHGTIRATARLVDGVEPGTVWTWNAIGKRGGAWALPAETGEATAGFLLNVLIDERLPPGPDGIAPANADPITGQAAWYDLRVRIEKAGPGEPPQTEPIWAPLPRLPGLPDPPGVLDRGAPFAGRRP
ncbi:MAG: molybdopterin-dependent oxidoreductase [Geminicoccaceae bacterium]|nr:molybdopterin-dependent oxidoreductase [Geminicoccaceae bacterium]